MRTFLGSETAETQPRLSVHLGADPGPPDLREGTGKGGTSPKKPRLPGRAGGQFSQQEGPWQADTSPRTLLRSEPGSSTHAHSWDPCSPLHPRGPPDRNLSRPIC